MQYLFSDYVLDTGRRELRMGTALVDVEPQVFDLLVCLIENRDRVVSRDDLIASVWNGRIVSESTITSRINAARRAIGDSGERQDLIRTVARKGVRFVAELRDSPASGAAARAAERLLSDQVIDYCNSADGTKIAFSAVGNGPPLVKTANWLSHLGHDWESPVWGPFLRALAADFRLLRYDQRGNGMSDWQVGNISFERCVDDLEAVVDAAGIEKFPLLGMSQGCAVSIAYAVRRPERLSSLILYGGYARGLCRRGSNEQRRQFEAVMMLMQHGWGRDNHAFRQIFTSQFIPGGSPEQVQWYNDLQRITTSPENAARMFSMLAEIDVTELLRRIKVPTLVLHCRDDARVSFEEGRRIAAGIPGARFLALEGANHIVLQGEPAYDQLLDEVRQFHRTAAV